MAHGVQPERLHFTGRIDPRDYLARFTVADLFLDTNPYGAGTTANDALWAGLPVLTMPGRTYVSRMAGALLTAADADELVADNPAQYEERAVSLAHRSSNLKRWISCLSPAAVRGSARHKVFNTPAICRSLETQLMGCLNA
jgi:predicted O-linked N-acetylglucosamine transferase (SPINDLY family)